MRASTTLLTGLEPRELLVALRPDRPVETTMGHALAIADEHRCRLTLLTVVRRPSAFLPVAGIPIHQLEEEAASEAEEKVRNATAMVPLGVSVRSFVRVGQPVPEILALLRSWPFDLLCLGAMGRPRHRVLTSLGVRAALLRRAPVRTTSPPRPSPLLAPAGVVLAANAS